MTDKYDIAPWNDEAESLIVSIDGRYRSNDDYESLEKELDAAKIEIERLHSVRNEIAKIAGDRANEIERLRWHAAKLKQCIDWLKSNPCGDPDVPDVDDYELHASEIAAPHVTEIEQLKQQVSDAEYLNDELQSEMLEVERKAKIDKSINNHLMHHLKTANFDIKHEQLSRFKMLMRRDDLAIDDVMPEVIKWAEDEGREIAASAIEQYGESWMHSSSSVKSIVHNDSIDYADAIRNKEIEL